MDSQITLYLYHLAASSQFLTILTVFFAIWLVPIMILALLIEAARRHWACFMSSVLGVGIAWGFSQLISLIYNRPRPFITLSDQIEPLIKHNVDWSFPSDHTVAAFAIATLLSMFFKRWRITVILYLLAIGVGLSRIAAGVHYPTDIIAGAILAILVCYFWFKNTYEIDEKMERKWPPLRSS